MSISVVPMDKKRCNRGMRENTRLNLSIVLGTTITVGLGIGTAIWVGEALSLLRGTAFELLAFPGIAIAVFGVGGVWYFATKAVYEALGGKW